MLGPAGRRPGSPNPSTDPVSVEPGAQPQMSSHNSRLAADSYKNCVWTISGEAPEFRAPVSCGVLPGSLKAHNGSRELRVGIPCRSSSVAAHPAVRWTSGHADPGPAPASPSPPACFLPPWPRVPRVTGVVYGPPQLGGISCQAQGTLTPLSPPPRLVSPGIQKTGARGSGHL